MPATSVRSPEAVQSSREWVMIADSCMELLPRSPQSLSPPDQMSSLALWNG